MPQRRNAIKALRINKNRNLHNLGLKADIKRAIKKFQKAVLLKNKEDATSLLKVAYKKIDKAVKENLLHRNTASRRKSRFGRLLKTLT